MADNEWYEVKILAKENARLHADLEQVTKERDALLKKLSDIRIAVADIDGFLIVL